MSLRVARYIFLTSFWGIHVVTHCRIVGENRLRNSLSGTDAQFGDTITIALNPPYRKDLPVALNELGIQAKTIYRNEDVAKILNVSPATIQWRCDRQKYGAIRKDAAGRRYFTLEDLRRIIVQERAPKASQDQDLYTPAKLARFLNLTYDRIRYLLDKGDIGSTRVQGNRVITREEVLAYQQILSNTHRP